MKKLIEWSDALSVGIIELDEQHRVLIDLLNEMQSAIDAQQGATAVQGILTRLAGYTRIHFAVEESLMRLRGYPRLASHQGEHRALIVRLNTLQRKVSAANLAIDRNLLVFLSDWLTTHIIESDQQYGRFFAATGHPPSLRRRGWNIRSSHPRPAFGA